ncbi:MAG: DUF2383 domain-containing protein [Alphaproteobacteria bacterium]|uniref:DUF2383 domain-containing protein n=1 Tax=Candidatus Bodocaedibacter vickermanii TaxID=2741701 RepID=A0A7L9RTE1_9PROT|nr:DUF2383 domain-containing protein [Alphaproteobacteria bacterium]QOL19893.1 hypothetical protein CPBP_00664 [Candidatus Paracaedibacteraceae bacterium 'Lake Konstanz']
MTNNLENLKESLDVLISIAQLDIDDAHAYDQAISNLGDEEIKAKFTLFKSDHERHILELSKLIKELEGKPPEYSRDFKGYLISGYTAVRSMMGTKGALEAMQTNEKMTVKRYEEALQNNLNPMARELLTKNLQEERLHLKFIENALSSEIWKK